jgi:hypothetical protein
MARLNPPLRPAILLRSLFAQCRLHFLKSCANRVGQRAIAAQVNAALPRTLSVAEMVEGP